MNILELPVEVLEVILSFVPNHLIVAQTCKTFYEISCRIKRYKITVQGSGNCSPGINIIELEESNFLLQGIVNSKRRIDAMRFVGIDVRGLNHPKALNILFERFGRNLSELELFKCLITMEQFVIRNDVPQSFQLDLPKLRKLTIENCPMKVLEVFNHLPDNVLTKVSVTRCCGIIKNVWRNQRNIKELAWIRSDHLAIDTRNLQLHSLQLTDEGYSRELLTGQGSLTSLALNLGLDQADIDTISTLELLEELEFGLNQFVNLSSLQKLTKLKKLEVWNMNENNRSFGTLKSAGLKDLIIFYPMLDRESTITLSLNCPNIRKLMIEYCYDDEDSNLEELVDYDQISLLKHFPNLETFSTTLPNIFIFPKGFAHHNLKRLYLDFDLACTHGFDTFLESCVVLETFGTFDIDLELLKIILTARPNLKVLCVHIVEPFTVEFISTFWELGKNIESFHITSKSADEVEKMIDRELKEINGGLPYMALMKAVRAKKTCCKK